MRRIQPNFQRPPARPARTPPPTSSPHSVYAGCGVVIDYDINFLLHRCPPPLGHSNAGVKVERGRGGSGGQPCSRGREWHFVVLAMTRHM